MDGAPVWALDARGPTVWALDTHGPPIWTLDARAPPTQVLVPLHNCGRDRRQSVQQAPAVTSLATMGVQQAPIVLPSPPTITFLVSSPHCRRPEGPCSDLSGHYGHPAGPHSAPFTSNYNLSGYLSSLQAPAVISLATMGVQQAPIVLPSPPTRTFLVTSPHCRRPEGPCSDLSGHYGHPAGPHSAPFSVKRFSTSCELQQGPTAPFYSLPPQSSKCVQQAPAVISLATMGVQQAPIVLPSPPTRTFLVTSPHCRRPPHSAPFSVKRFSTSCELQQGLTAPFYSLPPRSSKCNLLGYPPLTAGIQQAPAATSLAAMGVQHDPIVVSSL
ncbi:UNVERIFIED_CONTAM: hypothetical protein FKN15_044462 [Acipenser sinensis]